MTKEIVITVSTPDGVICTDKEFKDWVEFMVGYRNDLQLINPLSDYDLGSDDVYVRP